MCFRILANHRKIFLNRKADKDNEKAMSDYNLFCLLGTMVLDDESLSLFWF